MVLPFLEGPVFSLLRQKDRVLNAVFARTILATWGPLFSRALWRKGNLSFVRCTAIKRGRLSRSLFEKGKEAGREEVFPDTSNSLHLFRFALTVSEMVG